jgi:hypothetical protein
MSCADVLTTNQDRDYVQSSENIIDDYGCVNAYSEGRGPYFDDTLSNMSFTHNDYDDNESLYTDGNQSHRSMRNYGRHGTSKYHHKYNDGAFIGNDRGHMRIFRAVKGKRVPVEFYMSKHTPGTHIRNAISGIRENKCLVGKKEEGLFFKVSLAVHDIGQDPYGTLFYTSPEEYERHFYTTVPQSMKENWMKRMLELQHNNQTA